MSEVIRCPWAYAYPEYVPYHDHEWGRPVHDDRKLFEMFTLSGTQAGLSWITMLRRRENYREAFDHYDIQKIAAYDDTKIEELLQDAGIIRNRQKIGAVITNARAFMEIQGKYGSFDAYIWNFVDGKPIDEIQNRTEDVPVRTELSDFISADLKKRGFKFAGTTIVCAYMHTVGLMNGHTQDCFCREGEMPLPVLGSPIIAGIQNAGSPE